MVFLIIIPSYSVSGWSLRGGPGLFPFLCLSVHAFQNSRGSAGNPLLSVLVNIQLYYIFRHTVYDSRYGLGQQNVSFIGVKACKKLRKKTY